MFTAVILAGGAPAQDKLLQEKGVEAKSLLKIDNREMVRYIVDALLGSGRVNRLLFVGLPPDRLPGLVPADIPADYVPNQGDVASSVLAGLEKLAKEKLALICSADIPLLTSAAVNDFLDQCARIEADAYYPIVERSVMEARFPGCGRSYRVVRDGYFCGGDLFLVSPRVALANRQAVMQLTACSAQR
jgi:molybdopterin-guanine dinucleotide biosynthesis protein A